MFQRIKSPKERLASQDSKKLFWVSFGSILLYGFVFAAFLQVGTAMVQSLITGANFKWYDNIWSILIIAIYFFGRFAYSTDENRALLDDLVYLQDLIERQAAEIAELKKIILAKEAEKVEPEQIQEKPRG